MAVSTKAMVLIVLGALIVFAIYWKSSGGSLPLLGAPGPVRALPGSLWPAPGYGRAIRHADGNAYPQYISGITDKTQLNTAPIYLNNLDAPEKTRVYANLLPERIISNTSYKGMQAPVRSEGRMINMAYYPKMQPEKMVTETKPKDMDQYMNPFQDIAPRPRHRKTITRISTATENEPVSAAITEYLLA